MDLTWDNGKVCSLVKGSGDGEFAFLQQRLPHRTYTVSASVLIIIYRSFVDFPPDSAHMCVVS